MPAPTQILVRSHTHGESSSTTTSPRGADSVAKVQISESPSGKPAGSRSSVTFAPANPPASSGSPPSPGTPSEGDAQKRKTVTRSISSFFKNLFKSGDGTAEGESVSSSSKSTTAAKSKDSVDSRSLKSAFSFNSSASPHAAVHAASNKKPAAAATAAASTSNGKPTPPPGAKTTLLAVAPTLPPKMARQNWCMKDYAIVEKMYTGYASTVYKAWCKLSGETVCLKAYNMANLCELNRFQIYREVKLHSSLQHENIISLYAAFQEGDQVVLVQEYAESGDLFLLLHRYGGKLPERTAVEMVLYPFLLVLNYLHQHCVVHRDIKPENVLFTRSMVLKLCDFGLAIDLREERAVTRAGTLEYMAPEVLNCPFKNKPEENKEKENLYYSLTVDTWAVGVLTYELLVGFPPFNDKQRAAIEDKIRDETPRFPSTMSEFARNFIMRTLQKDALERPTITELIQHPWIKAHRRSSSMRAVRTPALNKSASMRVPTAHHEEDEEDDEEDKILAAAAAKAAPAMSNARTAEGDLIRSEMASFQSFTAGAHVRPKPLAAVAAKPQASTTSFSAAANPKLQALRAGLHH